MDIYRQWDKFEACSGCEIFNYCRGCPSVAKGATGNFYARDPQCWKDIQKQK
jgi:radical SAM protein with 4Fe4S-binding SPASM domain